ncbi:MAG: divIB [Clostridia bacterium]|nr:divIB [Clostridia bacterium]
MDKGSKKSSNKTNGKVSSSKTSGNKTDSKVSNKKGVTKDKVNMPKSKTITKKKKISKLEPKNGKKVIVLTVSILIMLAIIASSYYLLKTPKFNITSISVVGNIKSDINNIINTSEIKIGDNLIKSIFNINKKDILNIPYVSDVKISIKFPSEFIIKVTERKNIYFAYNKEKNLYYRLDKEGIILEVCNDLSLKEDETLVNGITFDTEVKINTKINDIDYSKILVYEKIKDEVNIKFPDKNITKVSFENSLTKIYLNDKIAVILPNDTNLKYNIIVLKDIIDNVGDKVGTIDMTKENPTFISF